MRIHLDYGQSGLEAEIPDKYLVRVLWMKDTPVLVNPVKTLKEKLNAPLASESLGKLASKSRTVCIVVSDKTRPVPTKILLPGVLEDNPCHKEALKIAKMTRVDFIVNVTLNSKKKITGIFAGDLEVAHRKGVRFCEEQVSDWIEEPVDIVVTSGGGYPLDCNFYQTVKGLVGALDIVKEGGTIIIASSCPDGVGSDEFKNLLFRMESPKQFLALIRQDGYFVIDQWEVEQLAKVLKKVRVKLYSTGLSDVEAISCHTCPIDSVERGIEEALSEYGEEARIAVIPNGPYLLARLKRIKNA